MLASNVRRNDPCPCGSGKRYKECHGSSTVVATLARAYLASGLLADATASARRAIALDATNTDAWVVLGLSLEAAEPDAALSAWEKAVALEPANAEGHFRIGDFHRRRHNYGAAVASYRAALAAGATHPVLLNNLGLALQEEGQTAEAEACYRNAIQQQPSLFEASVNLGDLLSRGRRFAEAVHAYGQALALRPTVAAVWQNLGLCQHRMGALAQAEASLRRAAELDPGDTGKLINLAAVLLAEQREAEAMPVIRKALALRPDLSEAQSMLLYASQHTCQWQDLDRLFEQQRAAIRNPDAAPVVPHSLVALPFTPSELLAAARKWVAHRIRPKHAVPPPLFDLVDGRLRIAYIGSDFRTHALANLLTEVIERHDRTRFEVFGYSFGVDDRSPARARFAGAFDDFVDVRAENFEQTVQRIREDRIAILFDTGGHVVNARTEIFAARAAPIQINCMFPSTLGADFYAYIMTDRFVTPPEQQVNFAERFMLLPHCYMPGDAKRPLGPVPTREQCQLPPTGFVFCCFNATWKIHPCIFDIWMRLLERTPGSVLWLLDSNAASRDNLREEARRRNVAAERLVFASRAPLAEHLGRHGVADLFLDTFPCNAHTTTNDALFAGLPVVTCAGETFASRVSGSHLRAIGLPELVTDTLADYEALALELAHDPRRLASYRTRLRANRDREPLFDTAGYTRALEELLWTAWDEWVGAKSR